MIISVVYLVVRRLLGCLMMLTQRQVSKESERLVLRHESAVLRRQISQVRYQPGAALGVRSTAGFTRHSHLGGAGLAASAKRAAVPNLLVITAARASAG